MLQAALEVHKEIYVSTANRLEVNAHKVPNDSRYPCDDQLMIFAIKCVEKGILKQEWIKYPFND